MAPGTPFCDGPQAGLHPGGRRHLVSGLFSWLSKGLPDLGAPGHLRTLPLPPQPLRQARLPWTQGRHRKAGFPAEGEMYVQARGPWEWQSLVPAGLGAGGGYRALPDGPGPSGTSLAGTGPGTVSALGGSTLRRVRSQVPRSRAPGLSGGPSVRVLKEPSAPRRVQATGPPTPWPRSPRSDRKWVPAAVSAQPRPLTGLAAAPGTHSPCGTGGTWRVDLGHQPLPRPSCPPLRPPR